MKYVQGGIIAANGIFSDSRVYPVQTISNTKGVKRDGTNAGYQGNSQQGNRYYDMKVNVETTHMAPEDCYTVTYNNNSQLQTFYYCPCHEYTY